MRSVFGNSTRLIAIGLIVALALFFVFQWSPRLTTGESLSETNGPLPATLQAPPSLSALQTRLAYVAFSGSSSRHVNPRQRPKNEILELTFSKDLRGDVGCLSSESPKYPSNCQVLILQ